MAEGRLEVDGEIDLNQFWPLGSSDADTTKIKIKTTGTSFRFRANAGARFKVTTAFKKATVRGRTTKQAIDDKGFITVRLQGIDAPELHYRPSATLKASEQSKTQHAGYLKWNFEYRQPLAESATVALATFLKRAPMTKLKCTVVSFVDHPNEVFDTYGRFVGEIYVKLGTRTESVNIWAVKNGWAMPAFYNSMSEPEIASLLDATDIAYSRELGVWKNIQTKVGAFDWNLRFRGKGASVQEDGGGVLVPKVFRRLSTWAVNKRAKMATGNFGKYLKAHPDPCFLTDDFLEQGVAAEERDLAEFIGADGSVLFWPEELVFKDAPSKLVGPGGREVKW